MTKQGWEKRLLGLVSDLHCNDCERDYLCEGLREDDIARLKAFISQELSTFAEEVEHILNRYEISSDGIDDNNDMLKGLIKEMRQALTNLKTKRGIK